MYIIKKNKNYNINKKNNILKSIFTLKIIKNIESKSAFHSTITNWKYIFQVKIIFENKKKPSIYIIFKNLKIKLT